jgi:hypothetical protein
MTGSLNRRSPPIGTDLTHMGSRRETSAIAITCGTPGLSFQCPFSLTLLTLGLRQQAAIFEVVQDARGGTVAVNWLANLY